MCYETKEQHFSSECDEGAAYWVGFGEHCCDAITHKIQDHETQNISEVFLFEYEPK